MTEMPVTEADFNLQGRVDNYREQLFELLVALDGQVQRQLAQVNQENLGGRGRVSYEPRPPRWTLAWKGNKSHRICEVNVMAFGQGGAWLMHGCRMTERALL